MRKLLLTAFCAGTFFSSAFSQVGIGTTAPNSSSVLDLSSTTKAFIPPRMNTSQRDLIANPIPGMMIFNSTTNCVEIYRTSGWYNLCTGGGTNPGSGPTSDSVAASNLIAHWTFDTDSRESISSVAATTSAGVAFGTPGKIGSAAAFSNGYLLYPTIAKINVDTALAAGFTFSTWAKFAVTTGANNLLTSLWQINSNIGDIWGTAAFTYRHAPNDTLDFDGTLTHVNGTGTHPTYVDAFLEGTASGFKAVSTEWVFITMVYDTTGGSKKLKYYGNGVLRGTKAVSGAIPATEQFELITSNSFGGTGRNNVTFGSFNYSPSPFAAGGGTAAPWQNPFLPTGTSVDDTRLYNKALSQAEITNLYNYGLLGK